MAERRTLWEIEVPFRRPLRTAAGTFASRRSVILAVEVDGETGWSEAPAFPSGRFGTADDAFDDLASGAEPHVPIASAALIAARADAAARAAGIPLHRHLGGTDTAILARHPLGLTDAGAVGLEAAWLDGHGLTAVKVKIAPDNDRAVVAGLREELPDLDIGVDGNGVYRESDDLSWLDELGVSFVEQPFPADDLAAHAALRERISTPICLDESITGTEAVRLALAVGAADQIAIKVNRHGLVTLAEIAEICAERSVAIRIGGTFDTSIGRRHVLAAATLPAVIDAEAGPPSAYLATDVVGYPAVVDGKVAPDPTPGIGVTPDRDRLDKMAIRTVSV